MQVEKKFMQRCLQLAKMGMGNVAPNPMVACVIVLNARIIGEGFHQKYGEAHAEVNALARVEDKSLLKDSTLYVSLEPCAHFGKTPPCADLIIKHEIKRVVIATTDSFSEVAGKGIEKLKAAGCDVEVGLMQEEARELNKRFFTFHEKKRPYVILKWAQSADAYFDVIRKPGEKGVNWISDPATKKLVHLWRSQEMAILVGSSTVLNDNPTLTTREVDGKSPLRIVLDPDGLCPANSEVFNADAPTILFTNSNKKWPDRVRIVSLGEKFSVREILNKLYELNVQSIMVEGGAFTLNSFIKNELWDEARVINGSSYLAEGVPAPSLHKKPFLVQEYSTDKIAWFKRV